MTRIGKTERRFQRGLIRAYGTPLRPAVSPRGTSGIRQLPGAVSPSEGVFMEGHAPHKNHTRLRDRKPTTDKPTRHMTTHVRHPINTSRCGSGRAEQEGRPSSLGHHSAPLATGQLVTRQSSNRRASAATLAAHITWREPRVDPRLAWRLGPCVRLSSALVRRPKTSTSRSPCLGKRLIPLRC